MKTLFIEPCSPWEYGDSFNSKLRDELLAAELFSTLHEAWVLIEQWRWRYRPHSHSTIAQRGARDDLAAKLCSKDHLLCIALARAIAQSAAGPF